MKTSPRIFKAAWSCAAAAALILEIATVDSTAGLSGATLRAEYFLPTISSSFFPGSNFAVGPAVELPSYMNNPTFSIDVSDTTIRVYDFRNYPSFPTTAAFSGAPFNGLTFSDIGNSAPAITSVTVSPSSTLVGFDNSRISFTADSISLNFQGLLYDNSKQVLLDVTTVPEPSSLALIGIAGLAFGLRRRR